MIPERCLPAKHVYIAVPTLTGEIKAATAISLVSGCAALQMVGVTWTLSVRGQVPYLWHVRNMLATEFHRDSSATDMVFIDSDIKFEPQDLVRLCLATRPFIAGIYPKKTDSLEFPVSFDTDELWSDEDGFIEASMVPTGFLRLNRAVLDALPHPTYHTSEKDFWGEWFWDGVLELESGRRGMQGEDPELCRQWKLLGGKIHIIPNIDFGHTGPKTWEGNWAKWMKAGAPASNTPMNPAGLAEAAE